LGKDRDIVGNEAFAAEPTLKYTATINKTGTAKWAAVSGDSRHAIRIFLTRNWLACRPNRIV